MERNSVVHVHWIVLDVATKVFKRTERDGADIVKRMLHEDKTAKCRGVALQLKADRLGTSKKLV